MAESIGKKFTNFLFGGLREDDFDEEEYFEEDLPATPLVSKPSSNKVVSIAHNQNQSKVMVFEPVSYDDAPTIVNSLKARNVVVVNLENVQDKEVAKTLFHFLNGAIYALDGDIRKVSKATFILVPSNIDIDGNIKKELETKTIFSMF